ncbi:MAG: HDOD domain-containing protein [Desulfobacter sp.]|nr:MAG: HDOD domain-containing protein [Desulfobacter sp.]
MPEQDNTAHSGFDLDTLDIPKLPDREPAEKKKKKTQLSGEAPDKIISLILKKIRKDDSFLTFTNQIGEVNRILQLKYASANDIAQVIVKDAPLTAKLLKLVNSSYYGQFSPDGISTITEAMIIVGTDQIKFMAASLKLIELMQNIGDSALLKEQILKNFQRSIIAGQIAKKGGYVGSEKLQVSAVLYGFGEYLVTACAPNTAKKIREIKARHKINIDRASRMAIGISYRDLGILVAGKWHMPKIVTDSMKPITTFKVKKGDLAPEDFLPFVCSFSDELCRLSPGSDDGANQKALDKIRRRYKHLFDIAPDTLEEILRASEEQILKQAALLNISLEKPRKEAVPCLKDKTLVETGTAAISRILETDYSIQDIFETSLKYLSDGFRFTNINFCIKDKRTDSMVARYVIGTRQEAFLEDFKFKIIKSGDLFNQSLHNDTIAIVKDVQSASHAALIPMWFKKNDFSKAFALVPIGRDKKIVSMLYLDWNPEEVRFCDDTEHYLHTFRALIVRALKKR